MPSFRATARTLGMSLTAILQAVEDGRLAACVVRDEDGRAVGISSPEDAARELAATTRTQFIPHVVEERKAEERRASREAPRPREPEPDDGTPRLAASRARREAAEADLRELELARAREEVVPAAEVEQEWSRIITAARDRLLAVPSHAAGRDPTLTRAQLVLIGDLIREALEALADGSHDW